MRSSSWVGKARHSYNPTTQVAMRICLLTEQELDAVPFAEDDWPCDPRPFFPDAEWTLVTLQPETAVAELLRLNREGFDLFFNLCDGAWDEGRVGVELVQTLERLNVPFTGASSEFFEPSREAMKRVCAAWGIATPEYVFAHTDEDVERAGETLRFPLFVKHPSSYASNGLTKRSRVVDVAGLKRQAGKCMQTWGSALIEEFIEGREATVLVAENAGDPASPTTYTPMIYTFPEGESFKHHHLKWVDYDGLEAHPVEDPELEALLRRISADFFVGMRGAGFGRCDIRIDADGTPYMLEINANCGVYYEPADAGSADLCLLAEPNGHERFTRGLVQAALERHARKQRVWEVEPRGGGEYVIVTRTPVREGETLIRFQERPHTLVSRSHVERTWSEREREWFRRYAWPLTDEIWVTWDPDPEDWKPSQHSCDPTAWLDGLDVVARRDLPAGTEVTLDYATFYNEEMPSFDCACGSADCRRVIKGTDYLQPFVTRYGRFVSDYVRRAREDLAQG